MNGASSIGKLLMLTGIILLVLGAVITLIETSRCGKLPGDILVKRVISLSTFLSLRVLF